MSRLFYSLIDAPPWSGTRRMQGWELVCWGVLGIPLLEKFLGFCVCLVSDFLIYWFIGFLVLGFLVSGFLGFLVSWFQGLLVSWLLGFKDYWFIGFLVSWIQKKSLVFLTDIWPILPICHFMFFDRYWFHIQDFQDLRRRIFIICRCLPLPKVPTNWTSNILRYAKIIFS